MLAQKGVNSVVMQRFVCFLRTMRITAPKLDIQTPSNTGRRGLFATKPIAADEFIASVPRCAILSGDLAPIAATGRLRNLPAFGALDRGSVELALALCAARIEEGSKWAPWVDLLPLRVPSFLTMQREEAESFLAGGRLEPYVDPFWHEVQRARGEYQRLYEVCGIREAVAQLQVSNRVLVSHTHGSFTLHIILSFDGNVVEGFCRTVDPNTANEFELAAQNSNCEL